MRNRWPLAAPKSDAGGWRWKIILRQTPDAAADAKQQSCVAENLKLLADFIADMAIIGMQLRQLFGKGASIAVGEFPISGGTISGIREKDSPGN